MARIESVALGGYYPTPNAVIPTIASVLCLDVPATDRWNRQVFSIMDPCAGDGEAALALMHALQPTDEDKSVDVTFYACELELSRFTALKRRAESISFSFGKECVNGDAFRTYFTKKSQYGDKRGVDVLFLNPPYDTDRVHGRLEQRFLDRFSSALAVGGVLVFVVPFYALKASAAHLALEYTDVRCYRFPEEEFGAYRQVALYAQKCETRLEADSKIAAKVEAWAANEDKIPQFPKKAAYTLQVGRDSGLGEWRVKSVDFTALLSKIRPWMHTTRGGALVPVPSIIPDVPVQDTLLRSYPVATPPRPAHIAAGIASGLFNGARIEATDKATKLPALLVKGVFDREYKTVEEKRNKDGDVKALVQIQQPKLVTTVLDLETHKYHILSTGTEETGSLSVSTMNVADLLKYYGESLMGVMERQCPVLYDPRRDAASIPLESTPRKLFTAQAHAARALVKLLGGSKATKRQRRGRAGILLGEIGSGKSTVALMTGSTIRAKRFLIMCPPHLLDSWKNEIASVLPAATVRVLSTVEDLQEAETVPATSESPLICILSRESAKLSHAWAGVGDRCPKCGSSTPLNTDLAKKRARCEVKPILARDALAREGHRLAVHLMPYAPASHSIATLLRGRFDAIRIAKCEKAGPAPYTVDPSRFDAALSILLGRMEFNNEAAARGVKAMILASWTPNRIAAVIRLLLSSTDYYHRDLGKELMLYLPPNHPEQAAIMAETPSLNAYAYGNWEYTRQNIKILADSQELSYMKLSWKDGVLAVDGIKANSEGSAARAISSIINLGDFKWGSECGEELFGAIPEPRRVSLATHISRYHKGVFDFLVLDEGHEYSTDGSAQERSAHRLTTLQIPTVLMTGTIMNGYAESLFSNMWALSKDFRREFARDERQRFVDRYGYRKRLVEDKDEEGEVVAFGSMSDRVTRSERIIGNAPGVLPLFLLKHLLTISVTLHKKDLAIDLPPCSQHRHVIEPTPGVKRSYDTLQQSLITQIRKDQFDPERSGRLFGQLAELPSYLDRATSDVGNVESGDYEIRYPDSFDNELVARIGGLSPDVLLPKEEWMLNLIEAELAEGRNVMVYSWHVALLPRLSKLIEKRIGSPAPILHASKVPTAKRQAWIDREIVKKGRRVLVTNPVAIQTGLNNLVHFASEIWMENPACNPVIFRQAIGRVDRIGQKLDTRIHVAIYGNTLQVQMYDLLMKKVAVSVSTDGLDPEAALQAAGLGEDDYLAGLSIGKQLWSMIGGFDADEAAA